MEYKLEDMHLTKITDVTHAFHRIYSTTRDLFAYVSVYIAVVELMRWHFVVLNYMRFTH